MYIKNAISMIAFWECISCKILCNFSASYTCIISVISRKCQGTVELPVDIKSGALLTDWVQGKWCYKFRSGHGGFSLVNFLSWEVLIRSQVILSGEPRRSQHLWISRTHLRLVVIQSGKPQISAMLKVILFWSSFRIPSIKASANKNAILLFAF